MESDLVLITVAIALGFFFQALTGVGGGLISISILSLALSPHYVIPLVSLFQLATVALVVPVRQVVDWATVRRFAPAIVVGALAGALLLPLVSEQGVRLAVGVYILFELVRSHYLPRLLEVVPHRFLIPLGALMNGMFGMGAPLMVLYLRARNFPPPIFRATVLTLLFAANCTRIPAFVGSHLLDSDMLTIFLMELPVFALAIWAGHRLSGKVSPKVYALSIDLVLVGAACALIARAVAP